MRKAIAKCLEQILANMDTKNIAIFPAGIQKQLFKILVAYMNDSNQDVRISAKKALLSLEYGVKPLGSRQRCINMI